MINAPNADVRDMYMVHTAFRREFSLMPALVRGVPAGDVERAAVVADHIAFVEAVLHHHHHGEDEHLWPRLVSRSPAEADPVVRVMRGQHVGIDAVVDVVTAGTAAWRADADPQQGAELADALESLQQLLAEHLGVEEDQALPLIEKHITAAEWQDMVAEGGAELGPERGPLVFGMMMYEADPEALQDLVAQMPPEVRAAMVDFGAQAFAEHSRRVHGTAAPARVGRR
jgi:hemerythrin-like domain-containing protein